MCGSSPLPDAVTRSTGHRRAVARDRPLQRLDRGRCTASASAGLVGPRFEPLEAAPLYGMGDVADGRLQKYFAIAERLADQVRADGLAVALDQAAVRRGRGTRACAIAP